MYHEQCAAWLHQRSHRRVALSAGCAREGQRDGTSVSGRIAFIACF